MKPITLPFALLLTTAGAFAQTWSQIGLDLDGEAANDQSGYSVSMPDANTVAIGAPFNDGNGSDAGQVRVYAWSGSTWIQKGADLDGEAAGDQSGYSVSMPDANTVAIGAPFNDDNGTDAGQVRVYAWSGSAWVQKGTDMDGEAADDGSGLSVSMPDANTVAIGAPGNDGSGAQAGHVRVYAWSGSAWLQQGADVDGEDLGDGSGQAVSMPDANTVAIGAPSSASLTGQVRVYAWSGSAWVQQGADIDAEAFGDYSGWSVSMPDANTVAIGAITNDGSGSQAGHVRVYTWSGSTWLEQGADIDGEAAGDRSGWSVSMPDANIVAIGAYLNSDNGSSAGQVRVYAWSGSAWVQVGADLDGEAAVDISGYSVSMPDSYTVAIGAIFNDGNGTDAGQVRVYSTATTTAIPESDANNLMAYPNPTTGPLTVELGQAYDRISVTVQDALGREISNVQLNTTGSFTLALDGPAGLYVVTVRSGNDTLARLKVLKQ